MISDCLKVTLKARNQWNNAFKIPWKFTSIICRFISVKLSNTGEEKRFSDMKILKNRIYAPFLGSSWKMYSINTRE